MFTAWCASFLRYQIEVMRPVTLVTLGTEARRFVAKLSPDLIEWSGRTAPDLRVYAVRVDDHPMRAIQLAHPSMYPVSVANRRFGDAVGVNADAALFHAVALVTGPPGAIPATTPKPRTR